MLWRNSWDLKLKKNENYGVMLETTNAVCFWMRLQKLQSDVELIHFRMELFDIRPDVTINLRVFFFSFH